MGINISYLICTTPRSGSNFLDEILTGTGLAGNPKEYFYEGGYPQFFRKYEATNFSDYFFNLLKATSTINGVFGAKIMAYSFFSSFSDEIRRSFDYLDTNISIAEMMRDVLPNLHYIWLTRRNRIRQAISHSTAVQTGIWHTLEKSSQEGNSARYSFKSINDTIHSLVLQDAAWQEYFTEAGIVPLSLVYEDFIVNPEKTAHQVLNYLGISPPQNWKLGEFRKGARLSNTTSEIWLQRYLQESQAKWGSHLPDEQATVDWAKFDKFGMNIIATDTLQRLQTEIDHPFNQPEQEMIDQFIQLSGEDIAQKLPIQRIIKALIFKVADQPGLRWLYHFRTVGKKILIEK